MAPRSLRAAAVFPHGNVGERCIVAQGLAIRRLIFSAEMCSTGFVTLQRIEAHEFTELEEVGHPARFFQ